jgi:hypothetical protein
VDSYATFLKLGVLHMGRIIVPQKRLGKIEIGQVGHLMKCVKTFKIFPDQRRHYDFRVQQTALDGAGGDNRRGDVLSIVIQRALSL